MRLLIGISLFILIGLISAPAGCLAGASRGLDLCIKIIIPSLFPFFVCSKLLIETGAAQKLGKWCGIIMRPIFNVPGCGGVAFVLGLLSGYPVGAQCAADMYEQNLCTKAEAERIACFCNNSGPLFIIGSVGVGMLYSQLTGILLYIIHILSAISVGFVLRFYKKSERMTLSCTSYRLSRWENSPSGASAGEVISRVMKKSAELILYVCGFIIFFSAFIVILERFGIIGLMKSVLGVIGLSADVSKAISFGIFEITNGCVRLAALPIGAYKIVFVSMLLAWSGLSVILQVTGILARGGLSPRIFVAAKLLQSVFAGVYAMLLCRIPLGSSTAFAYQATSPLNPWAYSLILVCVSISVCFVIALGCYVYHNVKIK